uniref:Inositol hexakisphosphate and diphosphoinositol-pentakisphosphate kinase n=1 Tax=Macrostomum lignano TaxID=282301 RepID=A0A1I8F449_9PLAT
MASCGSRQSSSPIAWPMRRMRFQEGPNRKFVDIFEHYWFEERDILEQPLRLGQLWNALISFYSHGFPLEKVAQYAELRKPFLVYERLREREIPVVRYAVCHRGDAGDDDALLEAEDHIVLNGKPLDADDHNIRIYFPSTLAAAAPSRLFRKVGKLQQRLPSAGEPRAAAGQLLYAIGGDYAHAEALGSRPPWTGPRLERDPEGKEMRCPVILTAREKIIAKKVVEAFNQTVCRLRPAPRQWSLLREELRRSNYDDCAFILATLLTQAIAPSLSLQLSSMDRPPLVRTTFGTVMELRCLIAVIRHSDRTSKQKLKMPVYGKEFYRLFNRHRGDGGSPGAGNARQISGHQSQSATKIRSARRGAERPEQRRAARRPRSWGERSKRHLPWRRELPPAATDWASPPAFDYYRHDLKIYASDEGRVQTTAAEHLPRMVQSGNTSGLLDSDNTARKCMSAVKCRIQESMSLDRDFTEADVQQIAPDGSAALMIRAMCNLGNPKAACRGMRDGIEALIAQWSFSQRRQLYHGETVELALGRWQKLLKDFQLDNDQFQLA